MNRTDGSDGGPAYPACNEANVNDTMGMTLRDYFAGQVLQGLVVDPEFGNDEDQTLNVGVAAYLIADAMIKARDA